MQGINISMDQYFTSVSLASWALEKNITIFGTMQHDRKGKPKELGSVANREEKSVMYVYHTKEKIMLTYYINKKKLDKKNVIVLSSMHDSVKVTEDQGRKPSVHAMYNYTKGGVDVVDLLSTSHSTRIKCKQWPLNAFAFILDTCRSNAKTILQTNRINKSSFEFTYSIGKALGFSADRRRCENSNGLQIKIVNKMRRFLGIQEVLGHPKPDKFIAITRRCFKCVESIAGTAH